MKQHRQLLEHIVALLVISLAGILVMWPLTHSGLFTAHDIWHQVARFYHYHETLSQGFWPPGWVATLANGYGYPLFYFSYHLPWMVGELLLNLGFSLPAALKLLFGGAVVASGWTFYLFSWMVTRKKIASVVAAVVYIIAPYHFLSVYVAAAIGTVFQFVFVPLMFLGGYVLARRSNRSLGIILLSLGVAGSILSHLMSTVMILPFLVLWTVGCVLYFAKSNWSWWKGLIIDFLIAGTLAFSLSAFYLLPLVSYKSSIIADSAGGFRSLYASHFVSPKQLLYSHWGFGPIISNAKDGEISLQVGIAQWLGVLSLTVLLLLFGIYSLLKKRKSSSVQTFSKLGFTKWLAIPSEWVIALLTVVSFAAVCFVMLEFAAPIWEFANRYMTLDYPWRLLLLAVFFGSVAVAFTLSSIKASKLLYFIGALFILTAWYTNRNHIGVNLYTDIPVADYVQAETTTNTFAEYLPRGASDEQMRKELPFVLEADVAATISSQTPIAISASVSSTQSGEVTLRHYAFPTLLATVDGVPTPTSVANKGLIKVMVPMGEHEVMIVVTQPLSSQLGRLMSIAAAIGILGYILWKNIDSYVKK